jgi:rare lipoprotein A
MYVPTTLNQPAGALVPVGIVSTAPLTRSLARTAISVSSTRLNVLEGHAATVTGTLRPGVDGRVVMLQALGGRGWSTVSRTRTRAKGRFELHFLTRRTGSQRVRVRFAGDAFELASNRRLGWLNTFRLAGASWYGGGGSMACGGSLTSETLGVANKTLPCGTLVTLRYGGRSVRVPVVDRGPYVAGREFDLTEATKQALGFGDTGDVWSTR